MKRVMLTMLLVTMFAGVFGTHAQSVEDLDETFVSTLYGLRVSHPAGIQTAQADGQVALATNLNLIGSFDFGAEDFVILLITDAFFETEGLVGYSAEDVATLYMSSVGFDPATNAEQTTFVDNPAVKVWADTGDVNVIIQVVFEEDTKFMMLMVSGGSYAQSDAFFSAVAASVELFEPEVIDLSTLPVITSENVQQLNLVAIPVVVPQMDEYAFAVGSGVLGNGNYFVIINESGEDDFFAYLQVFDSATGEVLFNSEPLTTRFFDYITYSGNNAVLVSYDTVLVVDGETGALVSSINPQEAYYVSLSGDTLFVSGYGETTELFDLQTGELIDSLARSQSLLSADGNTIISIVWSPAGYTADVYDFGADSPRTTITLGENLEEMFPLTADGTRLAVLSYDANYNELLQLFDLTTGEALWEIDLADLADGSTTVMSFSPDESLLLLNRREWLYIADVTTGDILIALPTSASGNFDNLLFSPDGRYIMGSSYEDLMVFGVLTD